MPLHGLGVDHVGRDRPGVGAEQRVRQGAVAPEDAGQVQPDQQLDERVDQLLGGVVGAGAGEQVPVGHRVLEVPGDQDRRQVVRAVDADAQHRDGRQPLGLEVGEQGVLVPGQALVDLLERVDGAVRGREADDVPRDAALRDLEHVLVVPVLEGLVPGQGQQTGGLIGGRAEEEPHAALRWVRRRCQCDSTRPGRPTQEGDAVPCPETNLPRLPRRGCAADRCLNQTCTRRDSNP